MASDQSNDLQTLGSERSNATLISFSGMDGAGKSTQIQNLCNALSARGISVRQLAFWDHVVAFAGSRAKLSHKFLKSDGQVGVPGNPARRNDKNARAWYLTIGRAFLYLMDAIKLRQIVKRSQATFTGVIVFDRYIYDQLATLPLDNPVARAYASLILKIVPRPDVPYLLDAIPAEARERKPEYPLDFLYKYRRSYLQLNELANFALIEPMSQDEARAAIFQKLERWESLGGHESRQSLQSVSTR